MTSEITFLKESLYCGDYSLTAKTIDIFVMYNDMYSSNVVAFD
jgi:hypothetical protein